VKENDGQETDASFPVVHEDEGSWRDGEGREREGCGSETGLKATEDIGRDCWRQGRGVAKGDDVSRTAEEEEEEEEEEEDEGDEGKEEWE
jgi:hypothetical protein